MDGERVAEGPSSSSEAGHARWSEEALLWCKNSDKKEGKGER